MRDAGIEYRHDRTLGNPKENHEPFRQGHKTARQKSRQHLQANAADACDALANLAHVTQIALLCYERDHDRFHRSCILDAIQSNHPTISIKRL